MKRYGNIYLDLRYREYYHKNQYRQSCLILKDVICKGKSVFKKVWYNQSKKHISCEGSNIFFENYRCYYSGMKLNGEPNLYFNLPQVNSSQKIKDALILYNGQDILQGSTSFHHKVLITLTADNHIRLLHMNTGQVLQDIQLQSILKCKELSWNTNQESFVVKSIVNRDPDSTVQKVMAVFKVFPVRMVGMMEIDGEIFGDVTNASISEGVLILMYSHNIVKMLDFEDILRKYKIKDQENDYSVNIKITEHPPILFQVKSFGHFLSIGGFRLHYIHEPMFGKYNICSFETNKKIEGGELEPMVEVTFLEFDRVTFFSDHSSRILQVTGNIVRLYDFITKDDSSKLILSKHIDVNPVQKEESSLTTITSSGRQIKKPSYLTQQISDPPNTMIYNVDYENEIDLIWISYVLSSVDEDKCYLNLYDHKTCNLLRHIPLIDIPETMLDIDDIDEMNVYMDLDTIVHIVKNYNATFHCTVYKLFGQPDNDDDVL